MKLLRFFPLSAVNLHVDALAGGVETLLPQPRCCSLDTPVHISDSMPGPYACW
jgi:hypothetical protein